MDQINNDHKMADDSYFVNTYIKTDEGESGRLAGFLAQSGLTIEDCPGWRLLDAEQVNAALGKTSALRGKVAGQAVEIPYYDADGQPIMDAGIDFKRYRILDAKRGEAKYLSRAMSENHLFVPAGFLEAYAAGEFGPGVLVITEGEKKAARACKFGLPCVALAGVYNWADKAARDAEKLGAADADKEAPRLSSDTQLMDDLGNLLGFLRDRDAEVTQVLVLYDADGALVERKAIKLGDVEDPRFTTGKGGEVKTAAGKRYVLNKDVYYAAQTLAKALRHQVVDLQVAAAYVPLGVEFAEIAEGGTLKQRKRLTRRGLDDWMIESDAQIVRDTLDGMLDTCVAESAEDAEAAKVSEERKVEHAAAAQSGGYVPLGIGAAGAETIYYIYSHKKAKVAELTETSVQKRSTITANCGVAYSEKRWGITSEDKETKSTKVINIDQYRAQSDILEECSNAGSWSPASNLRGAGVWYESPDSLLVNCRNHDVMRISGANIESVPRCVAGRTEIYQAPDRGEWSDRVASADEVKAVLKQIEDGWNWRRPTDGALTAGWLMLQAYVGALDARPHVYLTGESNTGKSLLTEYFEEFLGKWSEYNGSARDSSVAGIRSAVKNDAVTLLLDELEPKVGATVDEHRKIQGLISNVLQMLRGAYSLSRRGLHSAVKGTQNGGFVHFDVRTCALVAAIADVQLEQADKNRMIRPELRTLSPDKSDAVPAPLEPGTGAAIFRRMWERWPAYTPLRKAIEKLIPHPELRMRVTLASPIAAYLLSIDADLESDLAKNFIGAVIADYCADDGTAGKSDHDALLERLLALLIDIGINRKSLADIIALAVSGGMGQRGRDGGAAGAVLRTHGMSARLDEEGGVKLFVADEHPEFEKLSSATGRAGVVTLLKRIKGAEEAKETRGGRDGRVRLSAGGRWRGVWLPTAIRLDGQAEDDIPPDVAALL